MFTVCVKRAMVASTLLFCCGGLSAVDNHQPPKATLEETSMQFWDMPNLDVAFIDTAPVKLTGDIAIGELGVDGGDKALVLELANEIAASDHGKYDSLLISHKGKLLFESYYNRGRIDLPHFQFSATKGYTSLVLARAIQLGYLTMADLKNPLVDFFKDLDTSKLAVGVEDVTLHHVLSMRSGLRFSDEQLSEFRESREKYSGTAEVQAFLELTQPVTKESQIFKYQGSDPILVMHVIDSVVPGTANEFVDKEFFSKLDITDYKWQRDPQGMPVADSGVDLTSRDMVKIGEMLANKGKWGGTQLLSEEYLAAAFGPIAKATEDWHPENFYYGYFWYQTSAVLDNKIHDINLTWGAGGNRIILVNELDLIVVITGHDLDDVIFDQVAKYVLPAFSLQAQ